VNLPKEITMDRELLSESELDDRLHKSNPVDRAALDDEGVREALVAVRRSVESGAHRQAPSRSAGRPAYRRRWATLGAATAAVAVASLVGVETLTGGAGSAGLPLAVSRAAAAQLSKVAHAAAGQPTPGAGQLGYVADKIETTADPSFGNVSVDYTYDQTLQEWDGPRLGDARRQRMTSDGISFATPQDQANYLANKSAFDSEFSKSVATATEGPTATGVLYDSLFPPANQDGANLSQIQKEVFAGTERPNGPHALLADLAAADDAQPGDLWGGLLVILGGSNDAQLRATAYEALAYVPGTSVLGDRKDQLGRTGVAIQFTYYANGPTDTLIVSPSTGYQLQDDIVTKTPAGTMLQREVYLQRGIVDSVTAVPGGDSQPLTAATQAVNLASGTSKPALQTTTPGSQSTTTTQQTTPQTTTTSSQS
jgi:hypothetical protein